MGEKWPMNCLKMLDFHVTFRDIFTWRKSTTWDRRLYFPSEERRAEDFFFALKNPTASVGSEPANLGTKVQQAISRPPKPVFFLDLTFRISFRDLVNMNFSVFCEVFLKFRKIFRQNDNYGEKR